MRIWPGNLSIFGSLALVLALGFASPPGTAEFAWGQALAKGQGDWPRWCSMVAGIDGKLWSLETSGATNLAFTSADAVHWVHTPVNAGWGERYRPAFTYFKGQLWLLGGRSGTIQNPGYHSDVWSSENGTDWKLVTRAAGWAPRWDHTALVFGDRLWVLGGFGVDGGAEDIWSSGDGRNWTRVAEKPPWSKWKYRSLVVFRDRIWAVGFHTGSDVWSTRDGIHWEQATADAGWHSDSRYKHAIVFGGLLWVMGGADARGDFENDVWFSADGAHWSQQTGHAPWNPRAADYSVGYGDKLWIFGGKNADDDVWYLARHATEQ